jgi:hypothetical protein
MSEIAIAVEGLSKRYLVEHRLNHGYKDYTALRDVIGQGLRNGSP